MYLSFHKLKEISESNFRKSILVVLGAINGNQVHFSVRNESGEWNAARFIQEALADSGFGGGHQDMAGGLIPDARLFDKDQLYAKMRTLLNLVENS